MTLAQTTCLGEEETQGWPQTCPPVCLVLLQTPSWNQDDEHRGTLAALAQTMGPAGAWGRWLALLHLQVLKC